ncbi:uncharacterized protein [Watersipora subatra]|uniref:uncharacterized protein n=1 Tax=Watersipora subatra TaxID=2589382 RepID=UPI00355AD517
MESCSVASKVVSIGQHTLDNKIVLKASFPSADDTPASDKTDEHSAKFVVLLESTASKAVLSKFMKSRTKGSLTQGLGNGRYLVEYETREAAQSVVDQQVLTYMETKIHVRHYNLEEEEEDEEEEEEEENEDESQPSHVEIKRLTKMSPEDMHGKLLLHLKKATGNDVSASFQQSWDEPKQIFRFDMCPADISTLTNSAQFLNARGKKSKLSITSASTGHNVKVSSCKGSKKNLSKTQIKAAFGPKSIYSCKVDVISSDDREMELAFASCSVAALIVSKRKHELKNGMTVEASFPGVSAASSSSSNEDSEEEEIAEDEGILTREVPLPNQSKRTLVIRNLLDVDEEIIYFWVKSLLNVWPKSIQLSSDGESAIVKFSGCVDIAAVVPQNFKFMVKEHPYMMCKLLQLSKLSLPHRRPMLP